MEQLVKKVTKLREKARQYEGEIRQLLDISPDVSDPRSGCFGMVFNKLTLTKELLSYYYTKWSRSSVESINMEPQEVDRRRQDNWQRCMMILK